MTMSGVSVTFFLTLPLRPDTTDKKPYARKRPWSPLAEGWNTTYIDLAAHVLSAQWKGRTTLPCDTL